MLRGVSTREHVIVGAGPVGTALARRLAERGDAVRIVTRSGTDPDLPGVVAVSADASDPAELIRASTGADVLYNCANPGDYTAWERTWPPLAAAILAAATQHGAVLATASNLYPHGPVTAPMTAATPDRPSDHKGALRARLWRDALDAHEAGRVRAVEVRGSDYIGPTLPVASGMLTRYAEATLRGKAASVFGDPDQPHSWTAIDDMAATLAAVGSDERAWGRTWVAPSNTATVREALTALGARVGAGVPTLRRTPRWVVRAGGLVVPILREVDGILYQFDRPFTVDASETTEVLGVDATPWEPLLDATAVAWAARLGR
jgi:nucleoside-diphosphate-sugar epimerase